MGSHKNKSIREKLEAKYGKGCMFRNAGIPERIEKMGGIKTYKQFVSERKYKLKKIIQLEKQMTLHHLKHRSEGGATSERNGAVISALAHQYLHSLPREHEEKINGMLRDFKKCEVIWDAVIEEIDFEIKAAEISFSEELALPKKKSKGEFNRAKVKQETRRKIEEELEY